MTLLSIIPDESTVRSSIKHVALHAAVLLALVMGSKSRIPRTAMNHGSIYWQVASCRVAQGKPKLMVLFVSSPCSRDTCFDHSRKQF